MAYLAILSHNLAILSHNKRFTLLCKGALKFSKSIFMRNLKYWVFFNNFGG